ncbi:hypothetical protein PanWU01x14_026890, partial [Parasponia andersonii]
RSQCSILSTTLKQRLESPCYFLDRLYQSHQSLLKNKYRWFSFDIGERLFLRNVARFRATVFGGTGTAFGN